MIWLVMMCILHRARGCEQLGRGRAGVEGLATAGRGSVNGGERSWRFAPASGTNKKIQSLLADQSKPTKLNMGSLKQLYWIIEPDQNLSPRPDLPEVGNLIVLTKIIVKY